MSWITESNRLKHFFYAIPCAMLLTILFVGGLAAEAWSLRIGRMVENGIGWTYWLPFWAG